MARASKCRRVCAEPKCQGFTSTNADAETVTLSVVELETLRLCDLEGLEQDVAAARMDISRGSLQRTLYAARRSVADALVNGKNLAIQGGSYRLASAHCQCSESCQTCRFLNESQKGDGKL